MQDMDTISPVAAHVIEKCGGVRRTAEITGRTTSWVYRWTYPKDRSGTAGRIPHEDAEKIIEAARRGEVPVTPEDFFPAAATPSIAAGGDLLAAGRTERGRGVGCETPPQPQEDPDER